MNANSSGNAASRDLASRSLDNVHRLANWLTNLPRWQWLLLGTLVCATLPLFFSWPEYQLSHGKRADWENYWDGVVQRKLTNPWHDYTLEFSPGRNEAKRNFRLTVPAIAYATGTGLAGVHVTRFVLHAVLLIGLLLAAERAGRDRLIALAAALTIAGTYVGTSVWRDVCRWFDNCAHAFMVLALLARRPWTAGAAVLLAAFTDERALLSVPLLLLFHVYVQSRRSVLVGIASSVVAYLMFRLAGSAQMGFWPPTAGVAEPTMVVINLTHASLGYWFALEGGWLLILFALQPQGGRFHSWLCLVAATALPVIAATAVGDFTRSASYGFPASLAALALLGSPGTANREPQRLRRAVVCAAAVSLAIPNVMIMHNVLSEQSLPIRAAIHWLRTR